MGQIMNCAEWHNRIDAYVDGELPASDATAFRAHATRCPTCAAAALALTESKAAIRRAGNCYSASPEFRAHIFEMAKATDVVAGKVQLPGAQRGWRLSAAAPFTSAMWPRWAFATAALLLLAAGLLVVNRVQESKALAEFADLHVATLASANPVEVISTDRHTVKPWFQGRIPFTFDLPELQGSPFTLLGGRVVYFHQEPGAHLVFRYERHLISVFIFQETSQIALPVSTFADQTSSFRMQTWTRGGLRYVIVGDAGANTIQQLGDLLHNAG
jgi:anti-sigma factor RsiW